MLPKDATDARLGTSVESAPAPRRNTGDGTTRTGGAHNLKINYAARSYLTLKRRNYLSSYNIFRLLTASQVRCPVNLPFSNAPDEPQQFRCHTSQGHNIISEL